MLRVFSSVLLALSLVVPLSACAEAPQEEFVAGVHYKLLDTPVATADPGKIEVREFFFYGCPHCYDAETVVDAWRARQSDGVNFVRTPVLFLQNGEVMARAFYVAEFQGILDQIHRPLFDAIHRHHEPLFNAAALAKFFSKYGLPEDQFNSQYASFGVSTKVRQADQLSRDYKIRGVPAFAVNGKYMVMRENLKNDGETFKVIDFLVAKERKAQSK